MIQSNDIVHYYFGSPFRFTFKNGEVVESVIEMINDSGFVCGDDIKLKERTGDGWFEIDNFRKGGKLELILIHPNNMSLHQRNTYKKLCKEIIDPNVSTKTIVDTPASLHYLFLHGIDAFDLIETGQAIDKSTGLVRKIEHNVKSQPEDEPSLLPTNDTQIRSKANEKPYEFYIPPDLKSDAI